VLRRERKKRLRETLDDKEQAHFNTLKKLKNGIGNRRRKEEEGEKKANHKVCYIYI
jgi:hypothetical protein